MCNRFLDEVRHRNVRNRGKLPGIVELDLRQRLKPQRLRIGEKLRIFRGGPGLGNGIVYHGSSDSADAGGLAPFADRGIADTFRQPGDDFFLEFGGFPAFFEGPGPI